jgi:hypothetical protein
MQGFRCTIDGALRDKRAVPALDLEEADRRRTGGDGHREVGVGTALLDGAERL